LPEVTKIIASDLGLLEEWVEAAINNAPNNYKLIHISKKSPAATKKRETRAIYQPAIETKMIQRWLVAALFSKLPISRIATAFEPGASILKNAQIHRKSAMTVRVDLKDFFPSIVAADLLKVISNSQGALAPWTRDPFLEMVIRKTCFLPDGRLAVGFPSSPKIANVVMYELDEILLAAIKSDPSKFGRCHLTRYADDYTFSTDIPGACGTFVTVIEAALGKCQSPKLRLNTLKTRRMSRKSGSTLVTGLRIKPSGEIGVHARYKDQIRLMLSLYAKGLLKKDDFRKLQGHLLYIRHSDPALFTRLSLKHTAEIAELTGRREPDMQPLRLVA
jgi:RNA-directed DNA polymerase